MAPRERSGNSMLSSTAEPKSERDVFSTGLSREEWSLCLLVPLPSGYIVLVSHSAHQDAPPLWKNTQVLFHKAAFQSDKLQQLLVHGAIPPQVHNFTFTFLELLDVPISLFVQSHLSGPSENQPCPPAYQLLPCKSVCSYCPDFKKSQFWFLRDITSNQLPAGACIADITLWSQWESQFLTHLHSVAHLLSSYLTSLALRLLWGNM